MAFRLPASLVASESEETTTTPTRAILLIALLVLPMRAHAADDCLGAWRVGATVGAIGNVGVECRDGDPSCDRDGVADGTCRVAASYCLNVAGCAPGTLGPVMLRGAAGGMTAAAAALTYPVAAADVCTVPAEIAAPVRRKASVVRARVHDGATKRRDADRLRITCTGTSRGGRAVVVTTDFETGTLASVGVSGARRVGHPDATIHSDAVIRTGGGMVFVLNRFLGDNVQRLDPKTLRTRVQCTTGTASNPVDLVVLAPDKAYVTRYDRRELWIVDPSATDCARFRRGTIDLGAFADADGLPEMSQMAVAGGHVFVAIQRLDRTRGFRPTGPGRLVVIDPTTDAVTGAIVLHGSNPFGDATGILHEPGTGNLVIASASDIYEVGDGGLERIDPTTLTAEGRFFVDEHQLGGNVLDFVLLSPTQGFAIIQDAALKNRLVAFDPSGVTPVRDLFTRDAYLPDLVVGPDGLLWLADQSLPEPGIRFFDPATGTQVRRKPLAVGLPPFSIGFVP